MKVFELMTLLSKAHAGAEVWVSLTSTTFAQLESAEFQDETGDFNLVGGDANLIDEDGIEICLLSDYQSEDGEPAEEQE